MNTFIQIVIALGMAGFCIFILWSIGGAIFKEDPEYIEWKEKHAEELEEYKQKIEANNAD